MFTRMKKQLGNSMKTIEKYKIWKMGFYIGIVIYVVNLVCILISQNCLFIQSSNTYNYISIVLNGIFMFNFYNFLKKGSLTIRYLGIMFAVLVLVPFAIAIIAGGIHLR